MWNGVRVVWPQTSSRDSHGHYAGIDVSLKDSSVCVVDATGRIVREAKVASEPEALVAWFRGLALAAAQIGLEAGRCRNGCTLA